MVIACVQIANLPIALARRDALAPTDRPLILYAVEHQRAIVCAASHDAGVSPGVALRQARVCCPQATCLLADVDRERQALAALTTLMEAVSPRVERAESAPDAVLLLDLGTITLSQTIALSTRLRHRIRVELGLHAAIGLGSNRLIARHAAKRASLDMAVLVPPGAEAAFLAPQPISVLPINAEILERLDRLGLRTVGDVARLPIDALQAQFGGAGLSLYRLAHGRDMALIPKVLDTPTLSRTRRFDGPLLDRTVLEHTTAELTTRLAAQLLDGGWAAGAVALTLALDDGAPVVAERALAEPTSSPAILAAALRALCRSSALQSGVVAVQATVSDLKPLVAQQLELFDDGADQTQRLRDVLDRLQGRFAESLLCARLAAPDAQLPERRIRLERR